MTLWISNLMAAELTDQEITARVDALADYVQRPHITLILVTNEVGAGIVPEYPSGRRFREPGRTKQPIPGCRRPCRVLAGIGHPSCGEIT